MLFLGIFNQNGYLYEHGADLLAAIGTTAAVIVSLIVSNNSKNREKKEEIIRNNKTLELIDLISYKHNNRINIIEENLLNIENNTNIIRIFPQDSDIPEFSGYEIPVKNFEFINFPAKFKEKSNSRRKLLTKNKSRKDILQIYNLFIDKNVITIVEEFIEELNSILINHHLNLNSSSLDKINIKLESLFSLKEHIRNYEKNIEPVVNSVFSEMGFMYTQPGYENIASNFYKEKLNNEFNLLDNIKNDFKIVKSSLSLNEKSSSQ
ncbi:MULTISPECIES: hypothetical protein [Staphylococcus]|uniref:hypothetical protein n=1 Tax=Staphylococcus TaxID=1279 RepID=UPI00048D739B|nr:MULTISPECIES: hypothetical protein [Staphylococcus]